MNLRFKLVAYGAAIVNESYTGAHFSAFDFDIIREAFRKSVRELNLAEELWAAHD
ncbi:hypothetical protein [Mesorhizobium huakuii]|uniref:Uncharacterized protein n=1 Tax=Mesorhizobium huakuii TaxID=28104 RepID=A0A7G6T1G1_9HYPH|nr:hypothetical protein [Mesorhizobium huakuii]QND60593.1 hypothetical protein HB778_31805 [Mesorhizobium huakuii]